MRSQFEKEIERLKDKIIALGQLVEGRVKTAVDSFFKVDLEKAESVIAGDSEVDEKEVELEEGIGVLADYHSRAALDIAGTKGGLLAELDEKTTNELLSSAKFSPAAIRKGSRSHGVRTDATKKEIREAAEAEEREFYERRATEEWLADLEPLGTNDQKPFLETAP